MYSWTASPPAGWFHVTWTDVMLASSVTEVFSGRKTPTQQ